MKKIAIVMGGYTEESVISLKSGKVVYENLNRKEFLPYKIYIYRDQWILKDEKNHEYPINKHDFTVCLKQDQILKFDCVFNVIHGTPGEDGILQSYFHLLKIPYTGCNFHQSNITFNKKYCLTFLKEFGIDTAVSFFLNKNQPFCEKNIIKKVGLPCFVKPNRAGSSLGISKVYKKEDLLPSIEKAFKEDHEIIIESFLKGIEVSVGVISFNHQIKVLPITEIISRNDFFDFESKYGGGSQEITPARLLPNIERKIQKLAKKVCNILNLSGISRSEYILVKDTPFFLEINTIPGLSEESIFPKQLNIAGISLSDLFKQSIDYSIECSKKL
ncbi:MAG: D-alanine--D-alanine ligase [Flavobacteriales bacterium]|jgi:D-alanine-D-alanine ligase|uniref:D-alanine--D-alanine ligase n=1 Tax=Blattabacterium sp. (Mastotermes darwiniensis) TaxID=39768 RepID=UPI000231DED3|nr:D-alanine--D-alanine ligase [Blattabacterium sp. (Mastotermes darwiniensis)]AER40775.1 D-alanyl-alanine synthetase A [Blattabacterium sp. (Mastotermes darwiniensis) str. MADAR]MDR1804620.1 D-alanine--D-alanine ligase [Flavobacteriales bacterium]